MSRTIDTPLEYLLYALALGHVYDSRALLREVERWQPAMLANDVAAHEEAKALAERLAAEQRRDPPKVRGLMLPPVIR